MTPREEAPILSSGLIQVSLRHTRAIRLMLRVDHPAEGELQLVVDNALGTAEWWRGLTRVTLKFPVGSTRGFEEIALSLDREELRNLGDEAVIRKVHLVPSMTPQTIFLRSVAFLSKDSFPVTAARDFWSLQPGIYAAQEGRAVNFLQPPTVDGLSVWRFLAPIVLLASSLILLSHPPASRMAMLSARWGWVTVGAVWSLMFVVLVYHQVVALSFDHSRFSGRDRDAAYEIIDYSPLRTDMREVSRILPPGSAVDFQGILMPGVAETWWPNRARYYLYPIRVQAPASLQLSYFGGPHPKCAELTSNHLIYEGARYCLFEVAR